MIVNIDKDLIKKLENCSIVDFLDFLSNRGLYEREYNHDFHDGTFSYNYFTASVKNVDWDKLLLEFLQRERFVIVSEENFFVIKDNFEELPDVRLSSKEYKLEDLELIKKALQ